LNKEPLTFDSARSVGAKFVDETPAASFTVKESNLPGEPKIKGNNYFMNNNFKFRDFYKKTGQKLKNTWVEKEAYRIDSPLERKGITEKGQRAIRNKSLLGEFNLNIGKMF
jgi:hypothetical protein